MHGFYATTAVLSFLGGAFVNGILIENTSFESRYNLTKRDVLYYNNNHNQNQHHQHHSHHQNNHKRRRRHLTPSKEVENINPVNKYWYSYENSQQHQKLERIRRDTQQNGENNEIETTTQQRGGGDGSGSVPSSDKVSAFSDDEIGWTRINEEVDIVIPKVLNHFETLGITHLDLPEIRETLSIKPLFITYSAGLLLFNGTSYELDDVKRYGDTLMTYKDKLFLCKFFLIIKNLKFDYDFLLNILGIEGYGKVSGSLEDTVVYSELSVNVEDTRLEMDNFRIVSFRHIRVELNYSRLIREVTGAILSPITNLFRDRITTSISDGLRDQMHDLIQDFNNKDPLELRKFTKNILSGLTGLPKDN